MKRTFSILIFFLVTTVYGQHNPVETKSEYEFYQTTKEWFLAWKLVSKDIFKVKHVKPVDFVFFDDKYVYSTSDITAGDGELVKGNKLCNLNLKWKRALHNDTITLPNKTTVEVGLMSFAADISSDNDKPFFVMPLPSFWKLAKVESKELGLENLITGVFIHEFSHSQQMQNFGKKITEFEQNNKLAIDLTDDIIQNLFAKDSLYTNAFKKEISLLFKSTENQKIDTALLNKGLQLLNDRQKRYFEGQYESLTTIDDFFLTMEGLGQYSMYLWLTHAKGANIKREIAIEGVRRGGRWWSQDEGFALFLVLERLTHSKKWAKDMFGLKTTSVINLINQNRIL